MSVILGAALSRRITAAIFRGLIDRLHFLLAQVKALSANSPLPTVIPQKIYFECACLSNPSYIAKESKYAPA
jgi:hypothetical protein